MADGRSHVLMCFFHQLVDFGFGNAKIGFLPVSTTQGTKFNSSDSLSHFELATTTTTTTTTTGSDALGNTQFSFVASSNSFLLCKKEQFVSVESETLIRRDYYVVNPLTGQHKALPKPPDTILKFEFGTFICGGDGYPCLDWVSYKVVLGSDINESHLEVAIFYSQTGEWLSLHLSSIINFCLLTTGLISPVMSESETVCLASHATGYTGGCFVVFNARQKTDQLQMVNLPIPGFNVSNAMMFQSMGRVYMASRWSEVLELWELNEDKWIRDFKYNVKAVEIFTGGFKNDPSFLGLNSSNPAVALIALDGMNALVDLKEKSYVLTSAYADINYKYLWHSYQWPPCL